MARLERDAQPFLSEKMTEDEVRAVIRLWALRQAPGEARDPRPTVQDVATVLDVAPETAYELLRQVRRERSGADSWGVGRSCGSLRASRPRASRASSRSAGVPALICALAFALGGFAGYQSAHPVESVQAAAIEMPAPPELSLAPVPPPSVTPRVELYHLPYFPERAPQQAAPWRLVPPWELDD